MTTTIPRAELNAVGRRHGIDYDLDFDPSIEWVRAMSAHLRAGDTFVDPPSAEVLAEAADLDALADRYERKAS